MSPAAKSFIKAAIVYLVLGATGGTISFLPPVHAWVREWPGSLVATAHAHMNLLGWVSMMIYGVGYHILPRFMGRHLYSERLAVAHYWLANVGLAGMVGSLWLGAVSAGVPFAGIPPLPALQSIAGVPLYAAGAALFGAVELAGIYVFGYNLFRTMRAAESDS